MLTPKCKCGRVMSFPKSVNESRCPVDGCGMKWKRGPEGCWATGNLTTTFTPIFAREKACSVRSRKDRYANFPRSRKKKVRNAASRV